MRFRIVIEAEDNNEKTNYYVGQMPEKKRAEYLSYHGAWVGEYATRILNTRDTQDDLHFSFVESEVLE